jgi:hypothetical protein
MAAMGSTSNGSGPTVKRAWARTTSDEIRANDEWDALTTALNDVGVIHVAPGRRWRGTLPKMAQELFRLLLTSCEARLQQAAIVLLLTRPDLAADARSAIRHLPEPVQDRGMRRYVAAAAMQRMARTRIEMHLGSQPDLPSDFIYELGLPPLETEYGRATLLELARQEEALYGYDAWRTYESLLEHFLAEVRRPGWGRARVAP